jgi:lysophospholipase L1-like esterase
MERSLETGGVPSEVVNAGVGGYSTSQILQRMEEFKQLRPDVTVLFLGRQELFADRRALASPIERVYSVRAVRALWNWWNARGLAAAGQARSRVPSNLDPDAPELRVIERYRPAFLENVERIASEMKETGSDVFVVTLPALYLSGESFSPRALEIGQIPRLFRGNPYLFAAFVARYNELLREIAGRLGVGLIDLESWSEQEFDPRHAYFEDATLPNEAGQEKIGQYLADVLEGVIRGRSH